MRGPRGALPRSAGALLSPWLLAAATNLATRFRVVRAPTLIGKLSNNGLMQDRPVRLNPKYSFVEIQRAHGFAVSILYVNAWHQLVRFSLDDLGALAIPKRPLQKSGLGISSSASF